MKPANELTTPELVSFLKAANQAYRSGSPIIDDATYDHVYLAELHKRDPLNPFLNRVEPEGDFGSEKVRHERPMLSTEKAYTTKDMANFVRRVEGIAQELGIITSSIQYRITPKLDGMAGNYSKNNLVARGNGEVGNNVTHVFNHGVQAIGGANTGLGEIVLLSSAWENGLSEKFSHPRNVIVGLVGADKINEDVFEALQAGHVHFTPYSELPGQLVTAKDLTGPQLNDICDQLETGCGYPTDGSVIEVVNDQLKEAMGHTSHHYRWQIAWKRVGEMVTSTVTGVYWQTGRTGRVTPILKIDRVWLSGAWIENVTGHHAGNVQNLNIGRGCIVNVVRSGEVIPKLCGVVKKGESALLPRTCPSCDNELIREREFLICANTESCQAQIANRLGHFFSTIGNIDLFGEKTIDTLLTHGVDELPKIYEQTDKDFQSMGFGPKQAQNLVREINRSLTDPIEDWRFLAGFGIRHLGKGDSRRLLSSYPLLELPSVTAEQIQALPSFGQLKASRIASEIRSTWPLIESMINLGFNLTGIPNVAKSDNPIGGLNIVFTGKMENPRKKLEEQALMLGATPQSSVSKNTDILVVGQNVGSKKLEAARKHNTRILEEAAYLEMITSTPHEKHEGPSTNSLKKEAKTASEDQFKLFA
ncbi:BRCT domain-containing protein [Microbulbifer epialgicus]|uniref:DNA ligase n=1 Tax=Microbulbifer epialgicus TaxID=393907 RepID=A0ABV4NU61_9GAMM